MTTSSTSRPSSSDGTISLTVRGSGAPVVRVRCSRRSDGDFHPHHSPLGQLRRRQRAFVDAPWTMLDQSHGATAVEVEQPGSHDGSPGDVMATGSSGAVLGCWAADCAPIVVVGAGSRMAVAHAGWRGIVAGVLDAAVASCDAPVLAVALGPVIGPCCYEFADSDIELVADRLGLPPTAIRGRSVRGVGSLDVPAVIGWFAERLGVPLVRIGGCTGCEFPGFSYRVRQDPGRHVVAVWQEES